MSYKGKKKKKEPFTKEVFLRRNPMPFGDVRKYYLGAKVGSVFLFTLLTFLCVSAIALRVDGFPHISNGTIVFLILFGLVTVIGHYLRSIFGYAISAVSSLAIGLILFRLSGNGTMFSSKSEAYGEVFAKGMEGMSFFVTLAMLLSIVHSVLSVLFIYSTINVKEEPPVKGMNVSIRKFQDWFDKHNNSLPSGRRPLDYWFAVGSILCVMIFYAYNPSVEKRDLLELLLFVAGLVLIVCKQSDLGGLAVAASAVIRCTMYQYRYGFTIPVVAAYASIWIAVLYLCVEVSKSKRQISLVKNFKWIVILEEVFMWASLVFVILNIPIHQFLADFAGGGHLNNEKDSLPMLFFIPILALLAIRSKNWYGYLASGALYLWLWDAYRHSTPRAEGTLLVFDCAECHGEEAGQQATDVLMTIVDGLSIGAVAACVVCILMALLILVTRRGTHEE